MPPYVHPRALCESATVGDGTKIWAFAHVMEGAVIGRDCKIGGHAFVEDGAVLGDSVTVKNGVSVWRGVTLEDQVFVGPNAVFTNDIRPRVEHPVPPEDLLRTTVHRGASIGANATIVCDHEIGSYAFVAAGAVVASNVPDHALVQGVPARVVGWVCRCAASLDEDLRCPRCGRRFARAPAGLKEDDR